MGRAFPCATMMLACTSLCAATIESTCEWIDTGESCSVASSPEAGVGYSITSEEINGLAYIIGTQIPDLTLETAHLEHLTRLTYRFVDSVQFSFTVSGGTGEGILHGWNFGYMDSSWIPPDHSLGGVGMGIDFATSGGEAFTAPFVYGQPLTISIYADYFARNDGGYFTVDRYQSFVLRPPEGASFETTTPNPEPSTMALIACGIAGLLFLRRRLSRK
jgi:PEP-CTERM motif